MQTVSKYVVASALVALFLPGLAVAKMPPPGYLAAEHPLPTSVHADGAGGFFGETTTGTSFSQRPIVSDTAVRLHRFDIGSWHFYVSDRGAFRAKSDLAAISFYLLLG